ncbi:MAG: hypothetical protein GAK28_00151 [Luteibacter sp.]|uniref:hypothetical protein n=1 Tax=Luteibacter sp. TaxID=1886636 RepID=UPI00137F3F58|nr:hypothetical protein [Luteibacter sp.]KAF1009513.1 MAG: hypothetical protein GAK28_00151 [Luteibacter sp.]
MSRFYVGQRVRIKYAYTAEGEKCVGRQASILGLFEDGRFWVDVESICCPNGGKWRAYGDQLEPITDSYDKVEWSECLWRPTQGEVTA